jgi:hypothetical protein
MEKPSKQKVFQAIACLLCVAVLWIHLNDFGASEFGRGRLTGRLFTLADYSSVLFLAAFLLTFFLPRVAAAVVWTASLLCLPFYLYMLLPEPYRLAFKGEYSVPLQKPIVWNNWAVAGTLSVFLAAVVSVRSLFKERSAA